MGPEPEQLYVEWLLLLLYFPVWYSFTGAQAGLLTNENKKAFELYRYPQLESNKQNGKKESQTISVNWDEGEYL